ncbi:stage II sporulation protein M [Paenarthrobacter sp. Z7-10]|uniref:stage II sporulation protein M n=1 Tax=Paenarthrobacter sp. Z7-10 TaxID=2787635 RepID=UPI0022A8EEE7|nr:stage II sporulation protein M [Paenarthrobacter sp. Z7-10]MCZ2403258.1 stage II sporulation protein M [Paenarthrobacter sp. Z7-10]
MDPDAFAAVHQSQWDRLDVLGRQRRLSGSEADELLRLYQSTSAHLSLLRSVAPEGALSALLSTRLARARTRFTGARSNFMEDVARFFVLSLPAAFYRIRWLTLAVGGAFAVIAVLYGLWALNNPDVLRALGSDARLQRLVDRDFVDYYSQNPAASFSGQVWTNNAWIAVQSVALGITGAFVPYQIYQNALNVGLTGGVMFAYGRGGVFFSYILPHGLMELTAIFVAGAAGLRIFWSWISPGPRPRATALAQEARSLITVAIGLVFVFLASGLVEGFVTPSALPVWAKIGIGAAVLAGYWGYTLYFGGRAYRAGERGDLDSQDTGDQITAA